MSEHANRIIADSYFHVIRGMPQKKLEFVEDDELQTLVSAEVAGGKAHAARSKRGQDIDLQTAFDIIKYALAVLASLKTLGAFSFLPGKSTPKPPPSISEVRNELPDPYKQDLTDKEIGSVIEAYRKLYVK